MQTFTIQIQKKWIPAIRYTFNVRNLNFKIISEQDIPGVISGGDPDTELTIQLFSDDLAEIFWLGFHSRAEKLSITLI